MRCKGFAPILITPISLTLPSDGTNRNPIFQTQCIWDTGCSQTTITQEVVDALGLIHTGFCHVHTTSERKKETKTYVIDLYLSDSLVFPAVTVNLGMVVDSVGVLLGMDIIGRGDFSLTGLEGNTCMSFRYPSFHEIDFGDNAT